jgi:threonine-phosphate decarboxylase
MTPDFNYHPKYLISRKTHGGEIYHIAKDNDPTFLDYSTNINPYIDKNRIRNALNESITDIEKYPDSNSIKIRRILSETLDPKLNLDNFMIGAGAMDIITTFCDCFIHPNDKVLIVQPTFSEYEWAIQKNGGRSEYIYRDAAQYFKLNPDFIIQRLTKEIKAIFICNPNNPNGLLDSIADLEKIIIHAYNNSLFVFLDEAFIEFTSNGNRINFDVEQYTNLILCRSFTKFYGIPGLRLGYMIAAKKMIRILNTFHPLWAVNSVAQAVIPPFLQDIQFQEESRKKIKNERERVTDALQKIQGLIVFPSDANYLLLSTEQLGIEVDQLQSALLKENILIRNCNNYEGLNQFYFRICIKDEENNNIFIEKFKAILERIIQRKE